MPPPVIVPEPALGDEIDEAKEADDAVILGAEQELAHTPAHPLKAAEHPEATHQDADAQAPRNTNSHHQTRWDSKA